MAKSLNRWTGVGNVGRDIETKYTSSGTAVAKFSLAVSDRFKDRDGNWQDKTEWVNLVAWAKTAELLAEYVHKGDRLYVEGKLQTTSWEKDGQKQYRTEVNVSDFIMLGSKGESAKRTEGGPVTKDNPITDEDLPENLRGDDTSDCPF